MSKSRRCTLPTHLSQVTSSYWQISKCSCKRIRKRVTLWWQQNMTNETGRCLFLMGLANCRKIKVQGGGGAGAANEIWNQVFMIAPDRKFGRERLSHGKENGKLPRKAFIKFGKGIACFMFEHLRKSSSCPTSKFWTF